MNATQEAKTKAKAQRREDRRLLVAQRALQAALRQLDAEYSDRRAITRHEVSENDRGMRLTRAAVARMADRIDETITTITEALRK